MEGAGADMNISGQTSGDAHSQTVRCWTTSPLLSAISRLRLIRHHKDQFGWLDMEFANIRGSFSWLATQSNPKEAHLLIEYIQLLTSYLQQRGFQAEFLHWCKAGVHAAEILQQNTGWLLLLCGEALNALGQWDEARDSFQAAMEVSKQQDIQTHSRALLALGRLEFNQGRYRIAFETMNAAKASFSQEKDDEHLLLILGETAAYHLNRREFDKALSLYHEIDRLKRQAGANESSDHTLLMLGVVYRRKKDYKRASVYLQRLVERGEVQRNRAAVATASHHLAWIYLNQNDLPLARKLCGRSIMLYEEIGDERGLSDSYEQLGCIALAENCSKDALLHLQRSLVIRRQLHNQQGEASTLRHLAIVYLVMGHLKAALRSLWQSLILYRRLKILTYQRFMNIFRECLTWTLRQRQWVK